MTGCQTDLLDRAIAGRLEGALAAVAEPGRTWVVKLLARASEADGGGVWVQPIDDKRRELDKLIAAATPVEVAWPADNSRAVCNTAVLRRNKHYWLNDEVMLEAVLLAAPVDVRNEERRASPRLPVPDGCNLRAQLFRQSTTVPTANWLEIHAKLWNLSLGGACFMHPFEHALLAMKSGDPLKLVLHFRDKKTPLPARLVSVQSISSRIVKLGVQFEQSGFDPTARAELETVLAELTRRDALRHRPRR